MTVRKRQGVFELVIAISAIAVLFSGCSIFGGEKSSPTVFHKGHVSFGEAVSLKVGEYAILPFGENFTLISVSDSRCRPENQCIWEGRLSAIARLFGSSTGASLGELTFSLDEEGEETVNFRGEYVIVLVSLEPQSLGKKTELDPSEYRAVFKVLPVGK